MHALVNVVANAFAFFPSLSGSVQVPLLFKKVGLDGELALLFMCS